MNAASVVNTSSSSHRNARMMFDMMPSDPLPAITFSTLTSNSRARTSRRSRPPLGYRFKLESADVIASMALGEAPSGFSFEASLAIRASPYCWRTDSMVRPASYGRSDSIYDGTRGTAYILRLGYDGTDELERRRRGFPESGIGADAPARARSHRGRIARRCGSDGGRGRQESRRRRDRHRRMGAQYSGDSQVRPPAPDGRLRPGSGRI